MSKSNTTETDFLSYTFKATPFTWNASANLYVSLHTADPTDAGDQSSFEATYGSYSRVEVVRSVVGWSVSGNTAQNAALIQFPQSTGGTNVLTYVAIGLSSSGATQILYSGQLNSSLTVTNLIQPQFSAAALQIQED